MIRCAAQHAASVRVSLSPASRTAAASQRLLRGHMSPYTFFTHHPFWQLTSFQCWWAKVIDTKLAAPLTGSAAPCRHLARKHQLYGAIEKEMAQVDMLIDGVEVSRGEPLAVCNGVLWAVLTTHCAAVCGRGPRGGGTSQKMSAICCNKGWLLPLCVDQDKHSRVCCCRVTSSCCSPSGASTSSSSTRTNW